ncbi:MAG: mannitol dehydrogenase [Hyphomicrobiales bacterium]|nr:MAG: mannitol dehydrogenase [Hyphomicrobiales bacterium]
MQQKLNLNLLSNPPASVAVPSYNRAALSAGILHIGVGNFHRAHQGIYLDQLFNQGTDHDWAIIGAGVKSYDATMREKLVDQDWLTTIVELDPNGLTAKICGSMIDFIDVDSTALIEALAQSEIRIVSLTITEGGYYVDAVDGGFNKNHPEILYDIEHPDTPKSVFGILIAGLMKRKAAGIPAFTIMSCDNLPGNGHVAQQAMLGLAKEISPKIAKWIKSEVAFPNGMVDCITPATGDRERTLVAEKFGIIDASPVVCEPFRQWVLEDNFPTGRPALEKVGVEFVHDVAPYELMKLRILNGGHAAIAYPAALLGIRYVHDAMADADIYGFLQTLEIDEIIPIVPPVPGVNFQTYLESIQERFSNAAVGDTISRLCLDGSNRQPKFIFPSIIDRLEAGLPIKGLALEVALWCRFCAGTDDAGNSIEIPDENAERLKDHALRAQKNPCAFLEMTNIFGHLAEDAIFRNEYETALKSLWKDGCRNTLMAYTTENVYSTMEQHRAS